MQIRFILKHFRIDLPYLSSTTDFSKKIYCYGQRSALFEPKECTPQKKAIEWGLCGLQEKIMLCLSLFARRNRNDAAIKQMESAMGEGGIPL